ncbi:UNVERIFIED_CONTAM: hypothetical protein K2H54_062601, partial [Gekko kuhli]
MPSEAVQKRLSMDVKDEGCGGASCPGGQPLSEKEMTHVESPKQVEMHEERKMKRSLHSMEEESSSNPPGSDRELGKELTDCAEAPHRL